MKLLLLTKRFSVICLFIGRKFMWFVCMNENPKYNTIIQKCQDYANLFSLSVKLVFI